MFNTERRKILLVDDDNVQLAAIQKILEEEYEVYTADSGKKALDFFYKRFVPALILLDILMPEMDGWETFKRLKSISFLHGVPIAFLTSMHEETEKKHAQTIGAADFITKSFHKEDLLEKVRSIIAKYEK